MKQKNNTGLLLLAFLFIGTSANASGRDDDPPPPPPPAQEQDQSQRQGQDQYQDQDQSQGQEQDQYQETTVTAGASSSAAGGAGGNATINNEAQGDYKVDFRNNPNVYTNPPMPTVPCYKTAGFGASGGGVGLSLGGGKIDPYCTEREEIRLGHAIGMVFASTWRWCNLENNISLFGSAEGCLSANTTRLSPEYHLLMTEKNRLEKELRETQSVMMARCLAAEELAADEKERGDRANDAWLACQRK